MPWPLPRPLAAPLCAKLARSLFGRPLTDPSPVTTPEIVEALIERLDAMARGRLGRSLAIRHVDTGSCNGCELEVNALSGVVYDLERFGLRFVASPRHADVLLVTGPAGRNMSEALLRAHAATPDPKWVVAVGDCAIDGGMFQGSPAVEEGGIGALVPVDLLIPGCPPNPPLLLEGLLALLEAEVSPPPPVLPAPALEPRMEEWAEPRRDAWVDAPGDGAEDGPGDRPENGFDPDPRRAPASGAASPAAHGAEEWPSDQPHPGHFAAPADGSFPESPRPHPTGPAARSSAEPLPEPPFEPPLEPPAEPWRDDPRQAPPPAR